MTTVIFVSTINHGNGQTLTVREKVESRQYAENLKAHMEKRLPSPLYTFSIEETDTTLSV